MCDASGSLRITIVVVNSGIANFAPDCVPEKNSDTGE
jgi:hypothetical protein